MSYPHILTSLTESEAVADALYRAIIGFDSNDVSIFNSAFLADAAFEMSGNLIDGRDAIRTQLLDRVGPMDTTHIVSNVRVDVKDGASTASLTANAMAQHCPPGKGGEPDGLYLLTGAMYFIDLVKDESDGLWKVKKWAMRIIWRQGDRAVMESSA
jgi:hypothetical protein